MSGGNQKSISATVYDSGLVTGGLGIDQTVTLGLSTSYIFFENYSATTTRAYSIVFVTEGGVELPCSPTFGAPSGNIGTKGKFSYGFSGTVYPVRVRVTAAGSDSCSVVIKTKVAS